MNVITMDEKICTKCAVSKPLFDYYFDNKRNYARPSCKACSKKESSEHQKNTKSQQAKRQRDWRAKNFDKWQAYTQSYYEQNKDRIKEYTTTWNKQNRPRLNALMAKRKARELQALPNWADLEAIKTEYLLAKWCSKVTGIQYEVDHIIPLQGKKVCGLHTANNLQVIPMSDNRKKSNQFQI
jgi:G3E family GTPase